MTTVDTFSCQIILQKSWYVPGTGPRISDISLGVDRNFANALHWNTTLYPCFCTTFKGTWWVDKVGIFASDLFIVFTSLSKKKKHRTKLVSLSR